MLRVLKCNPVHFSFSVAEDQPEEMETEEFEGEQVDTKETEDETTAPDDEQMDAGKDEQEGQLHDEENTEGTEGNDEGENPKVSTYNQLFSALMQEDNSQSITNNSFPNRNGMVVQKEYIMTSAIECKIKEWCLLSLPLTLNESIRSPASICIKDINFLTECWSWWSNPPYRKRWRLYILPQSLANLIQPICTHRKPYCCENFP